MHVILSFNLELNKKKELEWQRLVRNGFTKTLYIPDRRSSSTPQSNNELWLCEVKNEIYRTSDGSFVIQCVQLVQLLMESEQVLTFQHNLGHREKNKWQTHVTLPDEYKITKFLCTLLRGKKRPEPGKETWKCRFARQLVLEMEKRYAVIAFELIEPIKQ